MDNPAKNTSHDFKENVSPSQPLKVVATHAEHLATQAGHLATQAEHLANQAEHLATQEKSQKRRHMSEDFSEGDNDCIVVEVRPPVHRRRISGPNLLPQWNSLFHAPKDRKPLAEHGGHYDQKVHLGLHIPCFQIPNLDGVEAQQLRESRSLACRRLDISEVRGC